MTEPGVGDTLSSNVEIPNFSDEELIKDKEDFFKSLSITGDPYGDPGLEIRLQGKDWSSSDHYKTFDALRTSVEGIPLLDLASAGGLSAAVLNKLGVTDYTGVDLGDWARNYGRAGRKFVRSEALKYLKSVPDNSTNVMSNAYLCADFFGDLSDDALIRLREHPSYFRSRALDRGYVDRILEETVRVLPKGGVFVSSRFDYQDLAKNKGLMLDENLSRIEDFSRSSDILVFRKP